MTTLLDRKVKFARKHWRAPGGEPFEIAEDGWLYQEYWRPLHSFRLAAVDKSALCAGCARDAGELVQTYGKPTCRHGTLSCAGVRCEPIQFVLLDLPRRSGKTVGTSGYVAASLFRGEGETIAFISGSEDQSGRLFIDHYQLPIAENASLSKRSRVLGTKILAWKKAGDMAKAKPPECRFEFMSTSISGTTGGKHTVIVIDEARAVPADVAAALLPTIWDQNGWECPRGVRGHSKTKGDLDDPRHQEKCATCGAELQPWVGKLLAMSSAGEITGGLKDWFFEACDLAQREPHPRVHVHRAQGVVNRKVAESSVNATAGFFSKVPSMRDSMEVETSNQARRRGEDFLSYSEISAVIDGSLSNRSEPERNCVAFLDTSDTGDLTSLVVVEDESGEEEEPWTRLVTSRLDVWDPKKLRIRIEAEMLERHLGELMPVFKPLRLRVDDRHAPWARNMVARLKQAPWGRGGVVVGCAGKKNTPDHYSDEERRFAFKTLEELVIGGRIRLPDNARLRKELQAARKSYNLDGVADIRDTATGKRGTRHLDVAEALAGCCFDVERFASRRPRATFRRSGGGTSIFGGSGRARGSVFGRTDGDSW